MLSIAANAVAALLPNLQAASLLAGGLWCHLRKKAILKARDSITGQASDGVSQGRTMVPATSLLQ